MTAPLQWRTACGASNTCVEIGWRTATASGGGDCVEVGCDCTRTPTPRVIHVRDSTDPDGPRLTLTPAAWRNLLDTIKEGR